MFSVEVAKSTFAAGEVSPELRVRDDLAKAQTGLWFLENMVVLLEGGVTRAPGSEMVMPYKDPARVAVGIPFRFSGSGSNAYLIVINAGVARFILSNSVVAIGGGNDNPYEVAVPYTDADLGGAGATVAGVSNLRAASIGNVVFLFCDGHPPQTLTRNADNSWTLALYITQPANPAPQGGCLAPVATENLDPTELITVALVTGLNAQTPGATVMLNASPTFSGATATVPNGFQAGHVGAIWRLDESDLSLIPEWTADETITIATQALPAASGYFGSMTNPAGAFGGGGAATQAATVSFYIGATYATAQSVSSVDVTIPGAGFGAPNWVTLSVYGKNGLPANATDGTLLGTITFYAYGNAGAYGFSTTNPVAAFTDLWIAGSLNIAAAVTIDSISPTQYTTSGAPPTYARYNGNVYQAMNGGSTGANPPVHSSGTVLSGPGGIAWLYIHRDRGFVQITAVANALQATATVLEGIPLSVISEPTANWWPSAWDGIQGWPNRVAVVNNTLRTGRQDKFWETQPNTFNNFDITDPTSPQSAIAGRLISQTGSLAFIEAFFDGAYPAFFTRDSEWVVVGQDPFSALTIQNLKPYEAKFNGSAQHVPAAAEGGLVAISRDRGRAMFYSLAFNGVMPSIGDEELTASARHILKLSGGGALGVSRQQDPNRVNWFWCVNGLLVGNTLMKEQQINGWHRHPQHKDTQSAVEWVATIPSSDDGVSWSYLGTKRTINGATARFVELMQPFFQPADLDQPTAAGAWFLDCALRYQGAPVTKLLGLNHLIGCKVNVHADGCMLFDPDNLPVVANDGTLQLPRQTQDAICGLTKKYRARLLPFDINAQHGSTSGAAQKANHVILHLVNSAGGKIAGNPDKGGEPEFLEAEPDALMQYGTPIDLFTGVYRTPGFDVPTDDQTVIEISGDDTMPFTLIGADPDVDVEETD